MNIQHTDNTQDPAAFQYSGDVAALVQYLKNEVPVDVDDTGVVTLYLADGSTINVSAGQWIVKS